MKHGLRRLGAASWLCLAVACVSPAERVEVDTQGWLEVRTPAFTILGNLPEPELVRLARELALFDAVVRKVTNTRIAEALAPVRLFVLRDPEQALALMPSWAAGVLYPTLEGYDAVLEGSDAPFWTRQVLLHEYAHYVLRGARRTLLPAWYDEGLSEYLAYMQQREDAIIIGRSATVRLMALERRGPLRLEQLFSVVRGAGRVDLGRFYATSWAFVHYVNTSQQRSAMARAFLARLVRGEPWRDAFAASFDVSLDALEVSFEAYVTELRRGARYDFLLPLDRVEVVERLETRELASAEIAYRLGRLFIRVADHGPGERARARAYRRARGMFAHAATSDPSHLRARSALALVDALEGRHETARTRIEAIGEGNPPDPVVALDHGRIAGLRATASGSAADAETARRLLERAVVLAPESPAAYAALAQSLARTSQRDPAIAAFERARDLGAWSPPLDLALAGLYREVGARERAIALLRPIAADLHRGDLADRAKRLLEELDPGR